MISGAILMAEMMFAKQLTAATTLDYAAADIFRLLGLKTFEERESSNYMGGHYFVGHANNVSVKVCLSDGATLPDFPFWIFVDSPRSWVENVAEKINAEPTEIARALAKDGWVIFMPIGSWSRDNWDERGTLYSPSPGGD
jgi:hypothetical protein